MMQQGVRFAAPPERHDQGAGGELRRHARQPTTQRENSSLTTAT
jgi:hypothetical protein